MKSLGLQIATSMCILIFPMIAEGHGEQASGRTEPQGSDAEDELYALSEPVDVVVQGRRRPQLHDTTSVTQVEGDRIRNSSRPTTFEAVAEQTPGLFVTSRGVGFHGVASGSSGGLSIRGLGGSPNTQVLVVEDGVPDYQGLFGHPIPDAYASFLIDRIRVIRGGDSVLYGTNALGGVLLIETRRRHQPGWELQNDLAYGSYRTLREQVAILVQEGDWDATGAFSALRSDGHRTGAGGANAVAQMSARWQANRTTWLTLAHKHFHGTGSDPGPVTHPTPDHWYDAKRSTTSLQFLSMQGGALIRAVQYANLGEHRLYDGFFSRDRTAGAYVQAEGEVVEGMGLVAGVSGDTVSGRVENRARLETENVQGLTNVAGYAQIGWQPLHALQFLAGGRAVVNSEYGMVPLYKLGIELNPVSCVELRTRLARNFRQPTIRERYLPYPTANSDLRPEYATTWDAGLVVKRGRIRGEGVVFVSRARDLIRYFGAFPTAEVVNIDSYDVWGIEGSLLLTEVGPFSARVLGSWQDVGRYTKQNPSRQAGVALGSEFEVGGGTVVTELSGQWVGGLYQNNYARDPMDDAYYVDGTVRWVRELPDRGLVLEPYLVARNLFDLEYETIRGYPMPGFNMLSGLKVTM